MGKSWDRQGIAYRIEVWQEALRVLKPGGHLFAFGGTRTYHRFTCAIEDAGFEVRDGLMWLYGSGFPKSYNVAQAIEKLQTIGQARRPDRDLGLGRRYDHVGGDIPTELKDTGGAVVLTTEEARQWDGWGTALKPAWEPIVLARKPLSEPNVAANVLRWGVGGLNIDGCRIEYQSKDDKASATPQGRVTSKGKAIGAEPDAGRGLERVEFQRPEQKGRWPANLMLECTCEKTQEGEIQGTKPHPVVSRQEKYPGYGSITRKQGEVVNYGDADGKEPVRIHTNPDCPAAMLDEQSGERPTGKPTRGMAPTTDSIYGAYAKRSLIGGGDSGGASRFFYCAKASRSEREAGLEDLPPINSAENLGREEGSAGLDSPRAGAGRTRKEVRNGHPTVKPIALMRYLVRLVTPPGGCVLDPFCGSGSTLIAAALEGFEFVGIDLDDAYCNVAAHRVRHWEKTA
jgi:site-specific DNA-methyltransferase (adenine-specific)